MITLGRNFRSATFWCWVAFFTVCATALLAKLWQNHCFYADQLRAAETTSRLDEESFAAQRVLGSLLLSRTIGNRWTRTELEKALPSGTPLALKDVSPNGTDPARKDATWEDPMAGVWIFHFNAEDLLTFYDYKGKSNLWYAMLPQVSRAPFEDAGEQVRHFVTRCGKWFWIALFVGWWGAKEFRDAVGQILLAVAIVCLIADLASPDYLLAYTLPEPLLVCLDALLMAVSVGALAVTSLPIRKFVAHWVLPPYFTVRWLMGLTTLVAAFIGMRWIGLLVLCMMVVAMGSFVMFSALFSLSRFWKRTV
jgi:hypothetical protein